MTKPCVTQEELDRFRDRLKAALMAARKSAGIRHIADMVAENGGDVISNQAADYWIRGKQLPSLRNLKALARGLGTSMDYLYG